MKRIFLGEEVELPEEILIPENNSCIAFSGDVINGNGYFSDSSENLCNLLEEIGIEKSLEFLKELKNRMVIPSLGNLLAFIAFKKDGVDKREETRVRTEKLNETTKALDLLIEVLEKNK